MEVSRASLQTEAAVAHTTVATTEAPVVATTQVAETTTEILVATADVEATDEPTVAVIDASTTNEPIDVSSVTTHQSLNPALAIAPRLETGSRPVRNQRRFRSSAQTFVPRPPIPQLMIPVLPMMMPPPEASLTRVCDLTSQLGALLTEIGVMCDYAAMTSCDETLRSQISSIRSVVNSMYTIGSNVHEQSWQALSRASQNR